MAPKPGGGPAEFPAGTEGHELAAKAERQAKALAETLGELEKHAPVRREPGAVACPLCFDTREAREEAERQGLGFKPGEQYEAHFMAVHFCACLAACPELPPDTSGQREVKDTRENGALGRTKSITEELFQRGARLEKALRTALWQYASVGAEALAEIWKELAELQDDVAELKDERKLGSPQDVREVSSRYGDASEGGAAHHRLVDGLRALASVLAAPPVQQAYVEGLFGAWETVSLPGGPECLRHACESALDSSDAFEMSPLGRQLRQLGVDKDHVSAAWMAAVLAAVTLLGGCKPAVVNARFALLNNKLNRAPLSKFVDSAGLPSALLNPQKNVGYRRVLLALYVDSKDGAEGGDPERQLAALEDQPPALALEDQEEEGADQEDEGAARALEREDQEEEGAGSGAEEEEVEEEEEEGAGREAVEETASSEADEEEEEEPGRAPRPKRNKTERGPDTPAASLGPPIELDDLPGVVRRLKLLARGPPPPFAGDEPADPYCVYRLHGILLEPAFEGAFRAAKWQHLKGTARQVTESARGHRYYSVGTANSGTRALSSFGYTPCHGPFYVCFSECSNYVISKCVAHWK